MKAVPRPTSLPDVERYREEHAEDANAPSSESKRVWDRFRDSDAYRSTLDTLIQEQQGLCTYCEQALVWTKEDRDTAARAHIAPVSPGVRVDLDSQIEHFKAKSIGDGRALDPGNFIACCSGGTASALVRFGDRYQPRPNRRAPSLSSCGQAKEDDDLPLDPRDLPIEISLVQIGLEGDITPNPVGCARAGLDESLLTTAIEKLNLNCARLKNIRRTVRGKSTEYVLWLQVGAEDIDEGEDLAFEQLSLAASRVLAPDGRGHLRRFWSVWRQALEPVSTAWILANRERLHFSPAPETVE